MFDRGLISLGDPPDYPILDPDGRLRRPADRRFWPSPHYLRFHREPVFKG